MANRNKVRLTTDDFIRKAEEVHGKKYDYSDSEYTVYRNKIKIICRDHGPFYQQIGNHLMGRGCYECGIESIRRMKTINLLGRTSGKLTVIGDNLEEKVKCLCECGKTKFVLRSEILSPRGTKSCGCLKGVWRKKHDTHGRVLTAYKSAAKARGLAWMLTNEEFTFFIKSPCYYCGETPNMHETKEGESTYNGIDRLDSDLGYTVSNCVPCCTVCNRAKSDTHWKDFVLWISKVYGNLSNLVNYTPISLEDLKVRIQKFQSEFPPPENRDRSSART